MIRKNHLLPLAVAAALVGFAAIAAPQHVQAAEMKTQFVTLGTNSGPIPNPQRSEPANLLRADGQNILVDVGDAAAWQLSKVGVAPGDIETILISHLHFDHTSGLFGFLSLRYQGYNTSTVTIYGPPGTKRTVDALVQAMVPITEMSSGMWKWMSKSPASLVKVIEIADGSTFMPGNVKVTAAVNSHYTLEPGSAEAAKFLSFSYRFDTPDRSIVYTGDTGPSKAVEKLAKGADLLVSEVMDPEIALAKIKDKRFIPFFVSGTIMDHFSHEHLSPTEVGLLASRAGVKQLVLTHNALPDEAIANAHKEVKANYKGPFTFAKDLAAF